MVSPTRPLLGCNLTFIKLKGFFIIKHESLNTVHPSQYRKKTPIIYLDVGTFCLHLFV